MTQTEPTDGGAIQQAGGANPLLGACHAIRNISTLALVSIHLKQKYPHKFERVLSKMKTPEAALVATAVAAAAVPLVSLL